uniref:Ectonucleoside triphosphate diphosphohydrolase 6 n=1 Tax=Molossus molossus TaxID=27622 RepID=A0A7J8HGI2_MOLMO|nr:ectonucleoside triphosphate diphosphohydrolase 6 [Molossus molossus]
MLELGRGSTQITFLPRVEDTLQTSTSRYLTSLQIFNRTYKLYCYRHKEAFSRIAPSPVHASTVTATH